MVNFLQYGHSENILGTHEWSLSKRSFYYYLLVEISTYQIEYIK